MAMKQSLQVDLSLVMARVAGIQNATDLKNHLKDIHIMAQQAAKEIQVFADYMGIAFNSQKVKTISDLERELSKSGLSVRGFSDGLQVVGRNLDGLRSTLSLIKKEGSFDFSSEMGSVSLNRMDAIAQYANTWKQIVSAQKEVASMKVRGVTGKPYEEATKQLQYYQRELRSVKKNLGVLNTEENNAIGKIDRKNKHIVKAVQGNAKYELALKNITSTQQKLAEVNAKIRETDKGETDSPFFQQLVKEKETLQENLTYYNNYAKRYAGVSKEKIQSMNDEFYEKQKLLDQDSEYKQRKSDEMTQNRQAAQVNNEYLSSLKQQHQAELDLLRLQQEAGNTPSTNQQEAILRQENYVSKLKNTTQRLDLQRQQFKSNDTQLKTLNETTEKAELENVRYGARVSQVTTDIKSQTNVLSSFASSLKMMFSQVALSGLSWKIFSQILSKAQEAITIAKDFDKALVDLQIASGGTREEAEALMKTYNELGREIGASTLEVAKSANTWIRQGYSIEDTNTLIRNSMILSKVGQVESAEATEYLTSAMKGYKVAVEDSLGVIDKFAKVDLMAATSSGDLAEAMSRTASSANLAGVSMDKLLGYLAVTQEVTQKSASSIGESKLIALKTG